MKTDQEWFYAAGGEQRGPISESALHRLFKQGALSPCDLVWRVGLKNWIPARTVEGLLIPPSLPGAPPRDTGEQLSGTDASSEIDGGALNETTASIGAPVRPWRRWLARLVDYWVAGFTVGVAIVFINPPTPLLESMFGLNILILFSWIPIEALMLAALGTTPGKALFNISVRTMDGRRLGFGTAVDRCFLVWSRGVGAGIPFISLFTIWHQHHVLTKNRMTSWDRQLNLLVRPEAIGTGRAVIAVLVVGFMLTTIVAGHSA
jgi:hypothetical protein